MQREIPSAVFAVLSEILARTNTHTALDALFFYARAPGDPPLGNKQQKALDWMRRCNDLPGAEPLGVLGRLVEGLIDLSPEEELRASSREDRDKILAVFKKSNLNYVRGGIITNALAGPSMSLETALKDGNLPVVEEEFRRALNAVERNPRDAVSAASNILESLCKLYIDSEGLEMPAKQDIQALWSTVRKALGFEPALVEDQDLKTILSGLISIVQGIGALRTHASSAHGLGTNPYRLEPRHARLAVHAAHTITLFILETWHKRRTQG